MLNKSIIRVEQPDINLEEHEEAPVVTETPMETDQTDVVEATPTEPAADQVQRLRITYQEYRRIADLLILHTRHVEEAGTAVQSDSTTEPTAIRKSELINWYLEEVAVDTLQSEADLIQCKLMVERILDRLIKKDHVLISLSRSGLDATSEEDADPLLVVHPNYSTD
ncbi:unnamed protein product [Schistocephalus solidus]|uniref:Mcm6 C-terminal winged-helix domain-containing protein n=1 Tax=Schistocephalus solidus TaxID=70667 RepID=A0A3P7DCB0_SCHSO|nr:unnamed protein product [Schistocephalus solidus]